jgi:5'-3' exonuclease
MSIESPDFSARTGGKKPVRLLVVDGTNIVRRYAFAVLKDRQAAPTADDVQRVLGMTWDGISGCAQAADCSDCVVAIDPDGKTWRHDAFPAYKANRGPGGAPPSWSMRLREYLEGRSERCVRVEGFEADDIVATIADRAMDRGHRAAIFSSDSDLLQMVDPLAIQVWTFGRAGGPRFVEHGLPWLRERYGVEGGEELRILKALVGEPGDNLPGVRGVGIAMAGMLLREQRTVERIAKSLDEVKREQFLLALRLVSLRCDVPLPDLGW